jgi:hypothetical protein
VESQSAAVQLPIDETVNDAVNTNLELNEYVLVRIEHFKQEDQTAFIPSMFIILGYNFDLGYHFGLWEILKFGRVIHF